MNAITAIADAPPALAHRRIVFRDGSSTELSFVRANPRRGRAILCLPAMGVRASYYEILADCFADAGFDVAMADHRGSGGSSVRPSRRVSFGYADILELELPAIVDAVCAEFGVASVVVVGHSLGGQLGLLFSARSKRVSHAVVIAGGSGWYRALPDFASSAGRLGGLLLMAAVTALWGYLPQWFPFAGREARGATFDLIGEGLTGRYRSARGIDFERSLSESTTPALFVVIAGDPLLPAACARHLAGKLTRAAVAWREIEPRQVRLDKADHFRWALRPGRVADVVTQWLQSTQGGAS